MKSTLLLNFMEVIIMNETIKNAMERLEAENIRSCWGRAVRDDAIDLLQSLDEAISGGYVSPSILSNKQDVKVAMLNGATNWSQFSWGGCALVYDADIANHYCTPSELKKCKGGYNRPNRNEEWLDVQARALNQAYHMAFRAIVAK